MSLYFWKPKESQIVYVSHFRVIATFSMFINLAKLCSCKSTDVEIGGGNFVHKYRNCRTKSRQGIFSNHWTSCSGIWNFKIIQSENYWPSTLILEELNHLPMCLGLMIVNKEELLHHWQYPEKPWHAGSQWHLHVYHNPSSWHLPKPSDIVSANGECNATISLKRELLS